MSFYITINELGNDSVLIRFRAMTRTIAELLSIVPFHKDFSPSGEQPEHRKLAHEL